MLPLIVALLGSVFTILAVATVVVITCLSFAWLVEEVKKRIKENKRHKVAILETSTIVDEAMRSKIKEANSFSMDELMRYCNEKPYVAVDVDKDTGELSDYEAIKPEEVEDGLETLLRERDGIILIEE